MPRPKAVWHLHGGDTRRAFRAGCVAPFVSHFPIHRERNSSDARCFATFLFVYAAAIGTMARMRGSCQSHDHRQTNVLSQGNEDERTNEDEAHQADSDQHVAAGDSDGAPSEDSGSCLKRSCAAGSGQWVRFSPRISDHSESFRGGRGQTNPVSRSPAQLCE